MDNHVSADVIAVSRREKREMTVRVGGKAYPIIRHWSGGFALTADTPNLPGAVEVCEGENLRYACLVVCKSEESGLRYYDYKRRQEPRRAPPSVDYAPGLEDDFV